MAMWRRGAAAVRYPTGVRTGRVVG